MTSSTREGAPIPPAGWWWVVLRPAAEDARVRLFALLLVVSMLLYLLPWPGPALTDLLAKRYLALCVFPIVLWALSRAHRRSTERRERLLWRDLLTGYGSWALVAALYLFFPSIEKPFGVDLLSDLAFLIFYASLVRASERRPELYTDSTPKGLDTEAPPFEWPTATLLVLGLLLYFQYLPMLIDRQHYENLAFSTYLYLVLDLFIFLRFVALALLSPQRRWKLLYCGLAFTACTTLLSDGLEGWIWANQVEALWSTPLGLFWLVPLFGLTAVAALQGIPLADPMSPLATERPVGGSWRTLLTGFVLPLAHFGFYGLGLFSEPTKGIRSTFVLGWLLMAGGVAIWQSVVQRRRHLRLIAGRERLSEALDREQKDRQEKEWLIAELETRNDEMDRFVYTVSHDLKTPLFTIQGFAGAIERDLDQANFERAARDLARVQGAAGKMQRLLDELLELSRVGRVANPPEDVELGEVVDEAASLVAGPLEEHGVELVVEQPLPTACCDRQRLVEVFQNLLSNATKFSAGAERPKIEVTARRLPDDVLCSVRDNGLGIAPEYHERVFMLFERLDPEIEGTGLGLALVRRIIEVHGGKVWIESEGLGRGTRVCFTLPLAEGVSR